MKSSSTVKKMIKPGNELKAVLALESECLIKITKARSEAAERIALAEKNAAAVIDNAKLEAETYRKEKLAETQDSIALIKSVIDKELQDSKSNNSIIFEQIRESMMNSVVKRILPDEG